MIRSKTIYEGFEGILFRNGKIVRTLEPGKHWFFGLGYSIKVYEVRPVFQAVGGQEVLTQDSAPLKISLSIQRKIVNVQMFYRASGTKAHDFAIFAMDPLTVTAQMALRDWATARSLEEAMNERDSMGEVIKSTLSTAALGLGLEIIGVYAIEFAPTGAVRGAYADLLKVELEGRASLARARNEGATMRSLLNTARLVREHPGLLELRVLAAGQKPRVNFTVTGVQASGAPTSTELPPESE